MVLGASVVFWEGGVGGEHQQTGQGKRTNEQMGSLWPLPVCHDVNGMLHRTLPTTVGWDLWTWAKISSSSLSLSGVCHSSSKPNQTWLVQKENPSACEDGELPMSPSAQRVPSAGVHSISLKLIHEDICLSGIWGEGFAFSAKAHDSLPAVSPFLFPCPGRTPQASSQSNRSHAIACPLSQPKGR